ncbi:MAG TPA: hypothetical protein VHP33_07060 [Polyangiaceae bacterium]|nr:hypothetical protein [Polyangiaceae bacterium]
MKRQSLLLAPLACLLPSWALAAPPAQLQLSSNSTCPAASDVLAELAPLLPRTRVSAVDGAAAIDAADTPPLATATIIDEGERVRIRVATEERVFKDAGRACSERARTAAVFIGLVLDPPSFPDAKPAPTPPPPRPAPPRQQPDRRAAPLTLELGPLLQAAPASDAAQLPVAGGFGGRLAWGRPLGVSAGAAFLLPTRLALPAADARLVWLPFDVAVRATHDAGPLSLSAELGPELALLFASGERVSNPRTSLRLEAGARGALSFTWGMSSQLGAFLTLFGVWRPKPYSFRVNPELASGTTPSLWVGAALGLSFRSR